MLVDCNAAGAQVADGNVPKFLGSKASELYRGDEDILQDLHRCFEERGHIQREVSYTFRSTGEVKQLIATYVFAPPDLVVVYTESIQERRHAEDALRRSEARLAAALEASGAGIYDHPIPLASGMYHNDRWAEILGYTLDELPDPEDLLSWMSERVHPEDLPTVSGAYARFVTGLAPTYEIECRIKHKGGEWVYTRTFAKAVDRDEHGRVRRMVGVMLDISQHRRAEVELMRSRDELRTLARRLQETREELQTSIARNIHDELGQLLSALKLEVSWLVNRMRDGKGEAERRSQQVLDVIDSLIVSTRKITAQLRPPVLDELGLSATLEWQVGEFRKLTGINCELVNDVTSFSICPEVATAVFRICQESLTNVVRHARATSVKVSLSHSDGVLALDVQDNGCGIKLEGERPTDTMGLIGMRERAEALGGSLIVDRLANGGTGVSVRIPLGGQN